MKLFLANAEKCKKDGICIRECPFNLLRENADGVPEMLSGAEAVCMRCGHCLAVCPSGAVSLGGVSPEMCEKTAKEPAVDEAAMEVLLKNRRSVRVYKDKAVPRETVSRLMEMLRWAPTAKNLQPVHWLLADDKEKIREMARLTVAFLHENNVFPEIREAWEAGEDMILRSAPLIAVAYAADDALNPPTDCAIATTSLELAATAFGIGSCWAGFFIRAAKHYKPMIDFLDLPEGHSVYAALMLGYPKFKYHRIPPRRKTGIRWF
ncbi:MAG: nitroreductase family protein [Desulfococcaceae bacterium]|jgi:nitroreductase/NAD-dependent dihydropyrimidine dehydrogenase PreA subunit|nr:nitroreductase family protein [Desulfococcaceae bacterium]